MMELIHTVTGEEAGLTLQQLLRGPMALSGRQTRNAKAQGSVTVNAAPFFANQRVAEGMVVRVLLDDYEAPKKAPMPENAPPVEVIYEDDALLAVLSAAVAAVLSDEAAAAGDSAPGFRVVSFRRTGRSWNSRT